MVGDRREAPVHALGSLRVRLGVVELDDTLARIGRLGAAIVGEVVQHRDVYRACCVRGPEGILLGLARALR